MKKIIAIGGSNSKNSINKVFASYTANKVKDAETIVVDLNDFDLPIYSIDLELKSGLPENATKLFNLIRSADGLIISLAEYNGSYTTAFKNVFDWMSRVNQKVWSDVPMLLMATSPGGRGGLGVLAAAKSAFPHLGGNIVGEFSLPSFYDNFSDEGIKNTVLNETLNQQIKALQEAL